MSCIFCKIIDGEIPAKILYENDKVMAFKDANPEAPNHLLVIPKKHIPSMVEVNDKDMEEIFPEIFKAIRHLAEDLKLDKEGYRIVNNCGRFGGQTVNHIHFHILGGRQMTWPPG